MTTLDGDEQSLVRMRRDEPLLVAGARTKLRQVPKIVGFQFHIAEPKTAIFVQILERPWTYASNFQLLQFCLFSNSDC